MGLSRAKFTVMRFHEFFRFRPTFWPTVFTVPSLIILIGLGTWQLERLHWKENLIAERALRSTSAPIPLPAENALPDSYDFSKTQVRGEFRNDKEMYLAARSLNGNVGYHVVTPLRLDDGSTILVDRGWIPIERKDPSTRSTGEIAGTVTLEGLLRRGQKQNWLVPDNEPQNDIWFYVDIPAMAKWANLGGVRPYFVDAGPDPNPGGYPIGGQSPIDLPNNHLQYAITWYSFAVSLGVIYVIYHRNLAKERHASESDDEAERT
ncbi:MAG TPA: SURF1 family protein [Alphaproteobacteria bacterium]|nr:SURF1 family protein [Alphaproteobacteria bacterium]